MLQALFEPLRAWFARRSAPARPAPARRTSAPDAPARASRPLPLIGARRPLVSRRGQIAGFEFHLDEIMRGRLRGGDTAVTAACIDGLLAAMRLCAGQGAVALAELPASCLAGADAAGRMRSGLWLCLDDPTALAPAQRQALRAAGARLGWRAGASGSAPVVDEPPDFLLHSARHGAPPAPPPGVPLVVLDLPDLDMLERALAAGAALATCALGRQPAGTAARDMPPQVRQLLQLMQRLVRDADHAEVVAAIKADLPISVQLLTLLNSAGVSPGRPLASIEDAVMLLGRDALYRWVATLLVRQAPARPSSPALQALALARARLLELLAQAAGEPQPGSLYLMGLASALPLLLQTPMHQVVASLPLPEAATQALLSRDGPWAPYLALAAALEAPNLEAARPLAEPFGGLAEVLALSARAWLPPGTAR